LASSLSLSPLSFPFLPSRPPSLRFSMMGSFDLLETLTSDVVSVVLPVLYCRCVVACCAEPPHQRLVHALALALVTYTAFTRLQHGWNALALVLSLQVLSTAAGWWICTRPASLQPGAALMGVAGAAVVLPLLPIGNLVAVRNVVALYAGADFLDSRLSRLALVTIEAQIALGHLGVAYLRAAQTRKNALLQCVPGDAPPSGAANEQPLREGTVEARTVGGDDAAIPTPWATGMSQRKQSKSPARPTRHEDSSTGLSSASHQARPPKVASCDTPKRKRALTPAGTFARRVRSFLLWWALPYFLQRCSLESINEAAAAAFADEVEASIRVHAPFASPSALAVFKDSNQTVDAHAAALRTTVSTSFRLVQRKIFSLPKLALFPSVALAQPTFVAMALPLALIVDAIKSKAMARLSSAIEALKREEKAMEAKRARVQAHDVQHASVLAALDATSFARAQWVLLTTQISRLHRLRELLRGVRQWIQWLYWQDVLNPGVEVGLAFLLEWGHLGAADIWLFARVVEDALDLLLMASRSEVRTHNFSELSALLDTQSSCLVFALRPYHPPEFSQSLESSSPLFTLVPTFIRLMSCPSPGRADNHRQ